jgi:hypothetical protein
VIEDLLERAFQTDGEILDLTCWKGIGHNIPYYGLAGWTGIEA